MTEELTLCQKDKSLQPNNLNNELNVYVKEIETPIEPFTNEIKNDLEKKVLSDTIRIKRCGECKIERDFKYFTKNKGGKFGLHSICNNCKSEYNKIHRVKLRKYQSNYRQSNKLGLVIISVFIILNIKIISS